MLHASNILETGWGRVLRSRQVRIWIARGLIAAWAVFWLWFNVASAIGEHDGVGHHLVMGAITLGLAVLAWVWPRVGGVLLVAGAVLAASAFPNPAALTLLALPAAGMGVICLLAGGKREEGLMPRG